MPNGYLEPLKVADEGSLNAIIGPVAKASSALLTLAKLPSMLLGHKTALCMFSAGLPLYWFWPYVKSKYRAWADQLKYMKQMYSMLQTLQGRDGAAGNTQVLKQCAEWSSKGKTVWSSLAKDQREVIKGYYDLKTLPARIKAATRGSQDQNEYWKDFTISGLSRSVLTLYASLLLHVLIQVAVSVKGHRTASQRESHNNESQSDDGRARDDYLALEEKKKSLRLLRLCNHLKSGAGLEILRDIVQRGVSSVVTERGAKLGLTATFNHEDLEELFSEIRNEVEDELIARLDEIWLPPFADEESGLKVQDIDFAESQAEIYRVVQSIDGSILADIIESSFECMLTYARKVWVIPNGKPSMFARVPKAIIKSYKVLYKRPPESTMTSGGPTLLEPIPSPMGRAITNSVNLDNLCKLIYTGDTAGRMCQDPLEHTDELSALASLFGGGGGDNPLLSGLLQ